MVILNSEYLNSLALGWYFICINVAVQSFTSQLIVDAWLECEVELKHILKSEGYTFLNPLSVFVDSVTCFDIWLDSDGDIQASDLYREGHLPVGLWN